MTIIFEEYVETKIRFVSLATKIIRNQWSSFVLAQMNAILHWWAEQNDCLYSAFEILYAARGG